MKYLEFCKEKGITTFPIRIDRVSYDPKRYLENGEEKKKKKLLRYDFANVTTNDFNNAEKCAKRWKEYHNGNVNFEYNAFAVDTFDVGCLDYDSILENEIDGEENPFKTILGKLPYKKSTSKSFGKHVLFDRSAIPREGTRRKREFHKKYGQMEFLDGLWEWNYMDDEIHFPERKLDAAKSIIEKLIVFNVKKCVEEYMNTVIPTAQLVEPYEEEEVPQMPSEETDFYNTIQKNIEEWTEKNNPHDERNKKLILLLLIKNLV